jgi:hypothetical protein
MINENRHVHRSAAVSGLLMQSVANSGNLSIMDRVIMAVKRILVSTLTLQYMEAAC